MTDSMVHHVLDVVPDLRTQPEWPAVQAELASYPAEIGLSSVCARVLGPHLTRLLEEEGDPHALSRALGVVEWLARSPAFGRRWVATYLLEWRVFRPGLQDRVVRLLGPQSRHIVRELEGLWAPWQDLIMVLDEFFDEAIAAVERAQPSVRAGKRFDVVADRPCTFQAQLSFVAATSSVRDDDVLFNLSVGRGRGPGPTGEPDGNVDSAMYEILRGSGEPLVGQLPSIALPDQPGAASQGAVIEYARQAIAHTWDHLELILAAVAGQTAAVAAAPGVTDPKDVIPG